MQMSIEVILDTADFDRVAENADLIFTRKGRLDSQSLRGKVVVGVARKAKRLGIPVIAVVGDIGDEIQEVYDAGASAVFNINRIAVDLKQARTRSKADMFLTLEDLMRFLKCLGY